MSKLRQWAREIRDARKVAEIHCPQPWLDFVIGLPHLSIKLDHTEGCRWYDIDWSWVLLIWHIGPLVMKLGLEDSD